MINDLLHGGPTYASALELRIDHQSPNPDVGCVRRLFAQRLVAKHHEPRRLLAAADGPIPSLGGKQGLSERSGDGRDKAKLVRVH